MRSFSLLLLLVLFLVSFALAQDSTCEVPGQCSDETASEETASEETSSEEPVAESKVEEPVVEDPQCPSRPHIIRCAGAHLDLNKNNKLERTELVAAIDSLPWYARGEATNACVIFLDVYRHPL